MELSLGFKPFHASTLPVICTATAALELFVFDGDKQRAYIAA
jgi:hypothetical protein